MPITKWRQWLSGHARRYKFTNVLAHLFGGRCQTRNCSAASVFHGRCVTNHKYIVEALEREVRAYHHATAAIVLRRKPLCCWRGHNTRRPDNRACLNTTTCKVDAATIAFQHRARGHHIDAHRCEGVACVARMLFGERRQKTRSSFDQHDSGCPWIDPPKVPGQCLSRNFGYSARHFDARGTTADDHECEQPFALTVLTSDLRFFKSGQNVPSNTGGVLDALEARSDLGPTITTEIGCPWIDPPKVPGQCLSRNFGYSARHFDVLIEGGPRLLPTFSEQHSSYA